MNDRVAKVVCFAALWFVGMGCQGGSASVMAADLLSEPSVKPVDAHLPVPGVVKAKVSGSGIQSKVILTLPSYHEGQGTRVKPTLFSADRFKFYDADGQALSTGDVAKLTPKLTSIFLVEGYSGEFNKDFAAVRRTALLAAGGKVAVMNSTQSSGDLNSGGAIATVNGLGLDSTFPSRHTAMDANGWLGRDDINKGFGDPDRYGWLHYDLGVAQQLVGLRIWNYNYAKLIRRAVRDIDVYVSDAPEAFGDNGHASWQQVAELADIPQGPGHLTNKPYGSDHTIKPMSARYIRLDVQRNWGNGWNTALAEVQFFAKPDKSIYAVTPDVVSAQMNP